MTFDKQPKGALEEASAPKERALSKHSVDMGRRRFTKSGFAASGVLVTLSSPSVMAAATSKTPSAFASGNTSSRGPEPISNARSPGYWKNHTENWPIPTRTPFRRIFNCSPSSVYAKYTMLDLLSPKADDRNKLGMHLVAAFLNARMGWTPFLSEEKVRSMFSQWQDTGYFSPSAGVRWDGEQIVTYLMATQG